MSEAWSTMLDVLVLCEGRTEREFCKSVVAPYIASRGVAVCSAVLLPHILVASMSDKVGALC